MNIANRYIHPQEQTIREAMERLELQKVGYWAYLKTTIFEPRGTAGKSAHPKPAKLN